MTGMAAPVGLDHGQVFDAAVALLEERGRVDGVTLREVAERLEVRTQSLYAHVDGLAGLRRALALRGLAALATELSSAAIGKGVVASSAAYPVASGADVGAVSPPVVVVVVPDPAPVSVVAVPASTVVPPPCSTTSPGA
jgi:AcrR family transcriptional regulator